MAVKFFNVFLTFWFSIFSTVNTLYFLDLFSLINQPVNINGTVPLIFPLVTFSLFFVAYWFFFQYIASIVLLNLKYFIFPIFGGAVSSLFSLMICYQIYFECSYWDVVVFVFCVYLFFCIYSVNGSKIWLYFIAVMVVFFSFFLLDMFNFSLVSFNNPNYYITHTYRNSLSRPHFFIFDFKDVNLKDSGYWTFEEWRQFYFKDRQFPDPTHWNHRIFQKWHRGDVTYLADHYIFSQPRFASNIKLLFTICFSVLFILSHSIFSSIFNFLLQGFGPLFSSTNSVFIRIAYYAFAIFVVSLACFLPLVFIFGEDFLILYDQWVQSCIVGFSQYRRELELLLYYYVTPVAPFAITFYVIGAYVAYRLALAFVSSHARAYGEIQPKQSTDQSFFAFSRHERIWKRVYRRYHSLTAYRSFLDYLYEFRDFRELYPLPSGFLLSYVTFTPISEFIQDLHSSYIEILSKFHSKRAYRGEIWRKRNIWFLDNGFDISSQLSPRLFPSQALYYRSMRNYWEEQEIAFGLDLDWQDMEFDFDSEDVNPLTGSRYLITGERHSAEFPSYEQSLYLRSLLAAARSFAARSFAEFKASFFVATFFKVESKYNFFRPSFYPYTSFFINVRFDGPTQLLFRSFLDEYFNSGLLYNQFSLSFMSVYSHFSNYLFSFTCLLSSKFAEFYDVSLPELFDPTAEELYKLKYQNESSLSEFRFFFNYSVLPYSKTFAHLYLKFSNFFTEYESKFFPLVSLNSELAIAAYDSFYLGAWKQSCVSQHNRVLSWYLTQSYARNLSVFGKFPVPGHKDALDFIDFSSFHTPLPILDNMESQCSSVDLLSNPLNSSIFNIAHYVDFISQSIQFIDFEDDVPQNFISSGVPVHDFLDLVNNVNPKYPSSLFYDFDKFSERNYFLDLETFDIDCFLSNRDFEICEPIPTVEFSTHLGLSPNFTYKFYDESVLDFVDFTASKFSLLKSFLFSVSASYVGTEPFSPNTFSLSSYVLKSKNRYDDNSSLSYESSFIFSRFLRFSSRFFQSRAYSRVHALRLKRRVFRPKFHSKFYVSSTLDYFFQLSRGLEFGAIFNVDSLLEIGSVDSSYKYDINASDFKFRANFELFSQFFHRRYQSLDLFSGVINSIPTDVPSLVSNTPTHYELAAFYFDSSVRSNALDYFSISTCFDSPFFINFDFNQRYRSLSTFCSIAAVDFSHNSYPYFRFSIFDVLIKPTFTTPLYSTPHLLPLPIFSFSEFKNSSWFFRYCPLIVQLFLYPVWLTSQYLYSFFFRVQGRYWFYKGYRYPAKSLVRRATLGFHVSSVGCSDSSEHEVFDHYSFFGPSYYADGCRTYSHAFYGSNFRSNYLAFGPISYKFGYYYRGNNLRIYIYSS